MPYSELTNQIQAIQLEPNSYALAAMLGEISEEEDAAGRGLITVMVVHKEGDMQPGPGFFEWQSPEAGIPATSSTAGSTS